MQKVKLLVVFLFSFFFLASFSGKFFSPIVTGQTGTIAAPTGVSASDGNYNNKVGINWNASRGATNYRIFRGTTNDSASAVEVGTTPAANFFDLTAVPNQTYFYWIRAENGSASSLLSQPEQGFRANGAQQGPVAPLEPPPAPPANPVTAAKANLGKILFWDEQLSATRTVSCGTCHQAGKGGSDARSVFGNSLSTNPGADLVFGTPDDVTGSRGVPQSLASGAYEWSNVFGLREQVTNRKSNSYINAAYAPLLFWDGRATGTYRDPLTDAVIINNGGALESQSSAPPVNSAEMSHNGENWTQVASQISNSKPLA
ncbi:MAG TPA: cytochrome c peroxidase, partial [Pyrinomonadaceae bacterium]|nr:cytochrome c peroxidase [Pyrinomonadaceae bacterium]